MLLRVVQPRLVIYVISILSSARIPYSGEEKTTKEVSPLVPTGSAPVKLLRAAHLPRTYKSLTALITLATRYCKLSFKVSLMYVGAIIIYM